jgi:hypothetical protein
VIQVLSQDGQLAECIVDVTLSARGQLLQSCSRLLSHGALLHLPLEIVAFCRELMEVAPVDLQRHCYIRSAEALTGLQKLDEAEEILHEGLAACGQEGLKVSMVSQTIEMVIGSVA